MYLDAHKTQRHPFENLLTPRYLYQQAWPELANPEKSVENDDS